MWKSMDRTRKGNETTAESMRNDTKRGADKTSGSVGNGGQARAKPGKARESPGRRGRARGGAAEAGEARQRPGRRGRARGGGAAPAGQQVGREGYGATLAAKLMIIPERREMEMTSRECCGKSSGEQGEWQGQRG